MNQNNERWPDGALGIIVTGFFIMLISSVIIFTLSYNFPLILFFLKLSTYQQALLIYFSSLFYILGIIIGGAVFGNYADKYGRKNSLMIALIGLLSTSLITGLFSFYININFTVLIYIFLLTIFILQGIYLGGEFSALYPMIMEFSKKNRRGFVGGVVQSGFLWAILLTLFFEFFFVHFYGQNGNQIAFLFSFVRFVYLFTSAFLIIILIILYILPESRIFLKLKEEKGTEKVPFLKIFKTGSLLAFLQILLLILGIYFANHSQVYITSLLIFKRISPSNIGLLSIIPYISGAFSIIFLGYISDVIGRKRSFLIASILTIISSIPSYYIIYISNSLNNLLAAMIVIGFITWWIFGLLPSYMSERFKTNVRASGIGLGYGSGYFLAFILESFWLITYRFFINFGNNVEVGTVFNLSILIIGSIIYGIAALIGPETKDLDLDV